jgi:hypothetical protein
VRTPSLFSASFLRSSSYSSSCRGGAHACKESSQGKGCLGSSCSP